jgi:hypothetical protein
MMEQQYNPQQEYNQELEKVQDKDFAHNWVSSSAFLFYLSVFCMVAFLLGSCFKLYENRYGGKPEINVPDNTKYTPAYK